jgi:hypothetical protein
MRLGLISDTHGLLRPEAIAALRGCDRLIHAGDIGPPDILEQLRQLAPLTVVRGNNDTAEWAAAIAVTETVAVAETLIHVIHDLAELDRDPGAAGVRVVVSGHSHVPKIVTRDGVLFVNPGSAGPRRFALPVTVAELSIAAGRVEARIIPLL